MQCRPVALEQPCLGQHHRARIDATEHDSFVVEPAQRMQQFGCDIGQWFEARDHQQDVGRLALPQGGIGIDRHAIARQHRLTVQAKHLPPVQLPTKTIGHPQWLHCRNEPHGRKAGHQQKGNRLHHPLLHRNWSPRC